MFLALGGGARASSASPGTTSALPSAGAATVNQIPDRGGMAAGRRGQSKAWEAWEALYTNMRAEGTRG